MKPFLLLLSVIVCSLFSFAQPCTGYYFLQNDKTIEMAVTDKKGNLSAKQVYKVSGVDQNGDATTAKLDSEMFDKKGKSIAKSQSFIRCQGGNMMVDMKMSIPVQPGAAPAETEARANAIYIEYPEKMSVGDGLKDATMHLEMENRGIKQTVDMEIFDRKVEGKETVTTPAGSWECYKISFKSKMKIKTMGMGMPMDINGTEWFAPQFGIVKTKSQHGGTEIIAIR